MREFTKEELERLDELDEQGGPNVLDALKVLRIVEVHRDEGGFPTFALTDVGREILEKNPGKSIFDVEGYSEDGAPTPPTQGGSGVEPGETIPFPMPFGVGLLGALFNPDHGIEGARLAQLEMIERRILRIEMLLRRAGIEPESIPLDTIR